MGKELSSNCRPCLRWFALLEHHLDLDEMTELINAIEMHTGSTDAEKRTVFLYATRLPVSQRQRMKQCAWRAGGRNNGETLLGTRNIGAPRQKKRTLRLGEDTQLESATRAGEKSTIMKNFGWP